MSEPLTELTRTLARAALNLHSLALAAEDVQALKSPATTTHHEDGIPRPTEDAALCPRRAAVVTVANQTAQHLPGILARLSADVSQLTRALDAWEGLR